MTSRGRDEAGLTLIEMMVAILVIGVVLMAMAATAIAAQRSMQTSERVVRATQLGNEVLETYLARDFEDLGVYANDATTAFGAATTYDGAELVIFPQPVTPDYERVPRAFEPFDDRDGVAYVARTAVVWASDTDPAVADQFKRIIVELTWQVRGEPRTSVVEALVARNPVEQMLTVVVEPNTVAISTTGLQQESFTVTVTAKEAQSGVNVTWEDRSGAKQTTAMNPVPGSDDLMWERNFDGKLFANGGTLFTVVGTLAGTTQKDVTTIGRALFLQPLDLPPALTTVVPASLTYSPSSASYCEPGIVIESEAHGAVFSDPMVVTIDPTDPLEPPFAMTAIDPPLTAGTLYRVELDLEDLKIDESVPLTADTAVTGQLLVARPTEAGATATLLLNVPVELTPVLLDPSGAPLLDADDNEVHAPCA